MVGAGCLIVSQLRFELHDLVLWPFLAFTATYIAYQAISLPVNFTGKGFDLPAHQAFIRAWSPSSYPAVNIPPACSRRADKGAAQYVDRRIRPCRGLWKALPSPTCSTMAHPMKLAGSRSRLDFSTSAGQICPCTRRPGNSSRYAFARTISEYLVILDADFAPRPDFLAETLPYLDDPTVAIVQTPQFFRVSPQQTWIENAAGAVQEVFYRSSRWPGISFGAGHLRRNFRDLPAGPRCEPCGGPTPHSLRRRRAHRA